MDISLAIERSSVIFSNRGENSGSNPTLAKGSKDSLLVIYQNNQFMLLAERQLGQIAPYSCTYPIRVSNLALESTVIIS